MGDDSPTLLLLNIALVALATVAAGAAIFGETIKNRRLTRVGWTALICAVSGFGAGVAKEVITHQLSRNEKAESDARNSSLQTRLDDTSHQLKTSLQQNVNLSEQLTKMSGQVRLSDAKLDSLGQRTDNLIDLVRAERAQPIVETSTSIGPGKIRGKVVDLANIGVPGVDMVLLTDQGVEVARTITGQDGDYELSFNPATAAGGLNLLAMKAGMPSQRASLAPVGGQFLRLRIP